MPVDFDLALVPALLPRARNVPSTQKMPKILAVPAELLEGISKSMDASVTFTSSAGMVS